MKTAISIPDDIFAEAEEAASQLGMSRSQLYVVALSAYLAARRKDGVTRRLDELYGRVTSTLDPHMGALQAASVSEEEW